MPTTLLDNETWEDAYRRRFQEEAAIDNRIRSNELNRLKVDSAVWLENYRQFRRPVYLAYAMAATRQALALYRRSHV